MADDAFSADDVEFLGGYTAKKPKTTLIRAFKQIINPKKVAEKDAIRNEKEHFAWIEICRRSYKRAAMEADRADKQRSLASHRSLGR